MQGFGCVTEVKNRLANGPGNLNDLMVQPEVTSLMQIFVLVRLLGIEIAQAEDATPTHTNGLGTRIYFNT